MAYQLRNIRGGGMKYVTDYTCNESKIFQAGLRHYRQYDSLSTPGFQMGEVDHHDNPDYERGYIVHARAPTNQFVAFGYMYGGIKKYILERLIINYVYRSTLRISWFPALLFFIFGSYHMRLYENNSYNFFYFSD